jgi:hypothetical protein
MMGLEQYISKDEILQSRTPSEYIVWFEEKLNIIRQRRDELKEQIILHQGIAKYFHEELFPLYRLLQNKLKVWEQVKFLPVIGSQNYDVKVNTHRSDVPQYIEITITDRDEEQHNRMEYFLKHEEVDLLGTVSISRKPIRKIDVEGVLLDEREINQAQKNRLQEAINRKVNAVKRMEGTALLVYFDDYTYFRYDNPKSAQEMALFLASINMEWKTQYTGIYIVGASGRSIWQIISTSSC